MRMAERPPSAWMIWPVIQADCGDNRNAASLATSSASPILFKGCLSSEVFFFSSDERSRAASGVFVNDGAMQLTRILGANSAASERVSPSSAPFAAAMDE